MRHAWTWKNLWRRIEVVKSDGLFLWIFDDEGSEEWRLAAYHVSLTWIDGDGTGIVAGVGDWMLNIHQGAVSD